jgi:hypothetical protein
MKNAYDELLAEMQPDEKVEFIVFGSWGWEGFSEPEPNPVPLEMREKVLTLEEAKPYMESWSFKNSLGCPECYAVYIWTNKRIFWVTQYDGSTSLCNAPRNPVSCKPEIPGG